MIVRRTKKTAKLMRARDAVQIKLNWDMKKKDARKAYRVPTYFLAKIKTASGKTERIIG